MKEKTYRFYWDDGTVENGVGFTPMDAIMKMGYSKSVMTHIDTFERIA
jgi:hypothetical protein